VDTSRGPAAGGVLDVLGSVGYQSANQSQQVLPSTAVYRDQPAAAATRCAVATHKLQLVEFEAFVECDQRLGELVSINSINSI